MSFMRATWYQTPYWEVWTSYGVEIVPYDVCPTKRGLGDYVGGELDARNAPELRSGWVGRLSAPGYLDATEWHAADTEDEIKSELAETYELCPVCLAELDAEFQCTEDPEHTESFLT